MSDNQDFDQIVGAEFADENTAEQLAAINILMDTVAELQKRVEAYEAFAKTARHARRGLMKAQTQEDAVAAMDALRETLRAIHPDTKII